MDVEIPTVIPLTMAPRLTVWEGMGRGRGRGRGRKMETRIESEKNEEKNDKNVMLQLIW